MTTFEEQQTESDKRLATAEARVKVCAAALGATLKRHGAKFKGNKNGINYVNGQYCYVEFRPERVVGSGVRSWATGRVQVRKNFGHRRTTSREPKGGFDFDAMADQLIEYAKISAERNAHSERLREQKKEHETQAKAIAKRTGFSEWSIDGHSDGISVDLPHMTAEQAERIVKLAVELGIGLSADEPDED